MAFPLDDDTVLEVWVGMQVITKPWNSVKAWFVPSDASTIAEQIRAEGTAQFHEVSIAHPDAKA